jgi:natural product precursor
MKHVKSLIKLTQLNSASLNEKELDWVIAGSGSCACGCYYSECGGSSDHDNGCANYDGGKISRDPTGQAEWNGAHME